MQNEFYAMMRCSKQITMKWQNSSNFTPRANRFYLLKESNIAMFKN